MSNLKMEEVEKELKALSLEVLTLDEAREQIKGDLLSVEFDIDTEVDYQKLIDAGLCLKKKTKRNTDVFLRLFQHRKGTISFLVSSEMPEGLSQKLIFNFKTPTVTSFVDLCWLHSEGTTMQTSEELMTKLREEREFGDLTWALPSRFIDDFIEIMHTLNQSILLGMMQEAFVYGPYVEFKKK